MIEINKEEARRIKVLNYFIDQRDKAYDGVPQDVYESQLKIALMSESDKKLFAITNEPTFIKNHGCEINYLTTNLHTTDDQGFEGQVMQRLDGSKWFCRWYEEDIGYNRELLK